MENESKASRAPGESEYIAFKGHELVATGDIRHVALKVKEVIDGKPVVPVLVFDYATSETIELDLRGTEQHVLSRLPEPDSRAGDDSSAGAGSSPGPGRPRLGVVAREVTLLPRHWDWLSSQPGGSSVALRKLVEEARRVNADKDRRRLAQDSTYRFISVMAGDLPGFEEAARALFACNRPRFDESISAWPVDVRDHAMTLANAALT